jgi:hypothetical protein
MKEPYPRCFDSAKQYAVWRQAARSCYPSPGHSYCEDCTPEYQANMIVVYRCEFPGTTFHVKADEGLHGQRSSKEVQRIRNGAILPKY